MSSKVVTTVELSAFTALEGIRKNYEEYKQKFIIEAKEKLSESFKEVFEKYPEIESIKWQQYTPYFNDGDECIFRVCDTTVTVAGKEIEGYISKWAMEYDKELEDFLYLNSVLTLINKTVASGSFEDVLKEMFGEHSEITVTKEGIQVEEYDHE